MNRDPVHGLASSTLVSCALAFALTGCAARPAPMPPAAPVRTPSPVAAPLPVGYRGGDGSSIGQAVVITNAGSESSGIRAEYQWLRNRYPGYVRGSQSLVTKPPKFYDALAVTLPDGTPTVVYFDITSFFGMH